MTEKFKKVKALLQRPAPPKKFGTDPWEPWSATNQVSENSIKGQRAGTLARFLKSRGINPTFVSKNQRIAHTKSDMYKKWMRDHMFEAIDVPEQPETADKNASDAQMSYAKKNKKKLHMSKNIETPPGSMVRKNMESVELDEVLTKSTTAGETIDDFVHSKNKMFAGDSKVQRIKRALGAYYKKQNEETGTKEKKKKTLNPGGSMPTTTNNKTSYSYNDMTEEAEDSIKESVIRSETIGPYTHELHKTPWGYQVRVHAGGKQVHSDITKPTEEKGHKSFDSNIAYTKKQLRIHEQGVAEGHDDFKSSHQNVVAQAKAEHGEPERHEYKFDNMSGRHGAHNSYLHYPDKKVTVNTQMFKHGPAHNVFVNRSKQGVAEGKEELHAQLQTINQRLKLMRGGPVGEPNSMAFVEKRKALLKQKEQTLLQLKQGVEEGWAVNSDIISDEKKDTRTASEKMSDYAVKRHKIYQGIADKQKEHIKKWNEDHKDEPHLQIPVKEDIYQDGQSATQTVFDMGNNTDDTSQRFNRVKNAMKKKHVKEDTYDWEKADKSVATPGKKPKMDKSNEKTGEATTKPKAAAVLSGGTTMTGEPRDTIEIDPSMQGRPGQDGGLPSAKTKR